MYTPMMYLPLLLVCLLFVLLMLVRHLVVFAGETPVRRRASLRAPAPLAPILKPFPLPGTPTSVRSGSPAPSLPLPLDPLLLLLLLLSRVLVHTPHAVVLHAEAAVGGRQVRGEHNLQGERGARQGTGLVGSLQTVSKG